MLPTTSHNEEKSNVDLERIAFETASALASELRDKADKRKRTQKIVTIIALLLGSILLPILAKYV